MLFIYILITHVFLLGNDLKHICIQIFETNYETPKTYSKLNVKADLLKRLKIAINNF